jgi:hypothetical protein
VTQSGRCAGPNFPSLWIVFTDQNGEALDYNEYLLRVVN